MRFRVPGTGVGIVWRRQMRGRRPGWDLLRASVVLAGLLASAWWLQAVWLEGGTVGGHAQDTLRRWLIAGAAGGALLFPLAAALAGAASIPMSGEADGVRAALLTRLHPLEIVQGRLLAALWPVLLPLALSCVFWLTAQGIWKVASGYLPILSAHLVLLAAVYITGAMSALFATRRVPGRAWGRGIGMALALLALCTSGIVLVDPQIRRMDDPRRLIEATLLINPVVATTTALQLDLLRTRWIYDHSAAPEFEFAYPPALATAGLFVGIGLGAQVLTALRLRSTFTRG